MPNGVVGCQREQHRNQQRRAPTDPAPARPRAGQGRGRRGRAAILGRHPHPGHRVARSAPVLGRDGRRRPARPRRSWPATACCSTRRNAPKSSCTARRTCCSVSATSTRLPPGGSRTTRRGSTCRRSTSTGALPRARSTSGTVATVTGMRAAVDPAVDSHVPGSCPGNPGHLGTRTSVAAARRPESARPARRGRRPSA